MTRLVVFVDTERADPYLNSVVHNLRRGSVNEVVFVHVHGFPGDKSSQPASQLASRILASVLHGIKSLALRAEYVHQDGTVVALHEGNGSISAEQVKAFYAPVERIAVDYKSQEIHYRRLRKFLRDLRRDGLHHVIDVTGCKKRFFGDFVALGLVDGLEDIRTFDLLVTPDYQRPWDLLLHELVERPPPAFDYIDILETRIMVECARAVFIRAPRLRYAAIFAFALVAIGLALNWYFGFESQPAKWVNVLAQFATLAALVFVFAPPRNS